jgi:predicted nucleic acid binding AN1-type Zn finger protein
MELLDRGKHCEEEFCHQLDYLPMKCKACAKLFCNYHVKYDDHNCKEAYKFNYKIPTCPTCNQTVEFQRGKDLDICLAEHMQNCNDEKILNKKFSNISLKQQKNKCSVLKCKTKDIIQFECKNCFKNYCVKHRIQEDHDCSARSQLFGYGVFKTCGQQHKSTTNTKNTNQFSARNY